MTPACFQSNAGGGLGAQSPGPHPATSTAAARGADSLLTNLIGLRRSKTASRCRDVQNRADEPGTALAIPPA